MCVCVYMGERKRKKAVSERGREEVRKSDSKRD